jgi:hypothetical protein
VAERGNPEVKRTFEYIGGIAEKKSDLHAALKAMGKLKQSIEPGGHPDYQWKVPPFGGWLEAKDAEEDNGVFNFKFAQIKPRQREWLNEWMTISWLWIWYGDVPPDRYKDPARRRAYLIQWGSWLHLEHILQEAGLAGLAFLKPHALEHREAGLSAVQLLAPYELTWVGNQTWDIPPTHPFWKYPLTLTSLFVPRCEQLSTAEQESLC